MRMRGHSNANLHKTMSTAKCGPVEINKTLSVNSTANGCRMDEGDDDHCSDHCDDHRKTTGGDKDAGSSCGSAWKNVCEVKRDDAGEACGKTDQVEKQSEVAGKIGASENGSEGAETVNGRGWESRDRESRDRESRESRSQYHSIQRLLSPTGRTSTKMTIGGAGCSSGSSLDFTLAPSVASGAAGGGYCFGKDPAYPLSDSLKVLQGLLEQQATRNDQATRSQDVGKPDRAKLGTTRDRWVEQEKGGEYAERSVEVSTNDFMDSVDENDSIGSPATDLSNCSGDEEMSDGDGILLSAKGRLRSEEDQEEEEEEEDNDEEDGEEKTGKSRQSGDDDVTSYVEDGGSFSDTASFADSVEAKRARMEFIVTNMKRSPSSTYNDGNQSERLRTMDPTRPKRKQYIPKQHDSCRSPRIIESEPETAAKKIRIAEKEELQQELLKMQERLSDMKEKYFQIFGEGGVEYFPPMNYNRKYAAEESEANESERNRPEITSETADNSRSCQFFGREDKLTGSRAESGNITELRHLATMLKEEISNTVSSLVDDIVRSFVEKHRLQMKDSPASERDPDSTAKIADKSLDTPLTDKPNEAEESLTVSDIKPQAFLHPPTLHNLTTSSSSLVLPQPVRPQLCSMPGDFSSFSGFASVLQPKPAKSKFIHPLFDHSVHQSKTFDVPRAHLPLFPPSFYHHPQQVPVMAAAAAAVAAGMFSKEPEQTEALPLIVNTPTKKKRTKVTDTRLSPRAARAILQENGQTHHRHLPGSTHLGREEDPVTKHYSTTTTTQAVDIGKDSGRSNNEVGDHDSFFNQYHQHHSRHHHHHHHHHHQQQQHLTHHPLLPVTLPTSVAIPNPSLQHSDIIQAMYGPRKHYQRLDFGLPSTGQRYAAGHDLMTSLPSHVRSTSSSPEMAQNSSDGYSGSITKADSMDNYDNSVYDDQAMTSTLTPMHLRKAKLMFFYVRYPSSSILKVYFPDVKFNKNNTAQLIKWFSNFREFYYIQMEKYARQALAEGVKNAGDLVVTSDSELYRVLILHYNRNNRIEVPDSFRQTVQATLREFFKSIQGEKDQEPSWKKAIYKIIAHLDDTVPEYFKSANWMEQLADG